MKARLFSKTGVLAGIEFVIENEALIGRDSKCDIVLYPHTVSSQHARITFDVSRNAFCIEDLGSSNGTFVDRTAVSEATVLGDLHVITLARDIDLIFQVVPADMVLPMGKKTPPVGMHTVMQDAFAPPPSMPATPPQNLGQQTTIGEGFDQLPNIPTHEPALDSEAEPAPQPQPVPQHTLLIRPMKGEEVRFSLKPGETIIGRSSACDITIKDQYLSGKHAVLVVDENGVTLRDLGSSNHTFIDDQEIEGPVTLHAGLVFRLGPGTKGELL